MANQAKVKFYDQLIEEVPLELGEVLEKAEVEFKRWHFEKIRGYVSALDVTYQQIILGEETKDDVTTKGKTKPNKEQGKSTKEVKRGKEIPADADIMDIFNEDDITPLSQFYFQNTIKEEHGNTNINTIQVGTSKEQTKGFHRLKVVIGGEGVETKVRKLIYGAMPPQVEHPTLAKRASIRPYTKNDMLHMMLEMECIMPYLAPKMYYLVHCF